MWSKENPKLKWEEKGVFQVSLDSTFPYKSYNRKWLITQRNTLPEVREFPRILFSNEHVCSWTVSVSPLISDTKISHFKHFQIGLPDSILDNFPSYPRLKVSSYDRRVAFKVINTEIYISFPGIWTHSRWTNDVTPLLFYARPPGSIDSYRYIFQRDEACEPCTFGKCIWHGWIFFLNRGDLCQLTPLWQSFYAL